MKVAMKSSESEITEAFLLLGPIEVTYNISTKIVSCVTSVKETKSTAADVH